MRYVRQHCVGFTRWWRQLVCCGEPMELLEERGKDEGSEKHVPVVEKTDTDVNVRVGSVPHPMDDAHYIEWIEITEDGNNYRRFLKPGDEPEAVFETKGATVKARAYCNVRGLWKS